MPGRGGLRRLIESRAWRCEDPDAAEGLAASG